MKGILLRVGCDQTEKGGYWNAPFDPLTGDYAYVPIPEHEDFDHNFDCPTYKDLNQNVSRFGVSLPTHLSPDRKMHLDPDYESLSIGEPYYENKLSTRGTRMNKLKPGDFIAFYASFRPTSAYQFPLAYCLFGIFFVEKVTVVAELSNQERSICAHGRRKNSSQDLVIWGSKSNSGRFQKAIPIGEVRRSHYRVMKDLLEKWGDLSVNDGWIQRSANPPYFEKPYKFLSWLFDEISKPSLICRN